MPWSAGLCRRSLTAKMMCRRAVRAAITTNQPSAAASVPGVLAARVDRVLAVAAAHGHRKLVLGAWGCGVFGNDPAVVAAAFAARLAKAGGSFDQVVFAVLDRQRGTPTHAAFARALGSASLLEKR